MSECKHCLQESYEKEFCCSGCEAAYHLIKDSNLDSYYEKRVADNQTFIKPVEAIDMDFTPYTTTDGNISSANFMVDGIHCAACIWLIERILTKEQGIEYARVNMTTRRLKVTWNIDKIDIQKIVKIVSSVGYRLMPYDPKILENKDNKKQKELLLCMAVAGFVSANVMLLSVATWAGTGEIITSLMQWFSALLAMPGIAYAGQPFFKSAINALKHKHMNMDVPISLAVIITAMLSLYEVMTGGETYFESAIMLLFFLLIGRFFEQKIQVKSRSIMENLSGLQLSSATILVGETLKAVPVETLKIGDILVIAKGEKCAADGIVTEGVSSVDNSMLTGENIPEPVEESSKILAGSINMEDVIYVRITAVGDATSLAKISELVEKSIQSKNVYTPIVDTVAKFYSPVVHILAFTTLIGWLLAGASFHEALLCAVAVLIVTCPCAIALAVPTVAVATGAMLFKEGVILKSPTALERLRKVNKVAFDKTGTLTLGLLKLIKPDIKDIPEAAVSLAANSSHPLSVALVKAFKKPVKNLKNIAEIAGQGLKATYKGKEILLGSAKFCDVNDGESVNNQIWIKHGKETVACEFADVLRPDAKNTIQYLQNNNYSPLIISGDRKSPVTYIAKQLGITDYKFLQTPENKHDILKSMSKNDNILMVGDGINDAPALSMAYVSMAPASASAMAQVTADVIFQTKSLSAVALVLKTAYKAHKVTLLNFAFALSYNAIAIPLAVSGYINPLWAAVFMSTSSVTVMLNAMRMTRKIEV